MTLFPAVEVAAQVRAGQRSAASLIEEAIATIAARDGAVGAVTRVLAERGRAEAATVDAKVAAGIDPGPLAGLPYGVKDLFDVAGLPTTAGAGMRRDVAPAAADAIAVQRLSAAGAVLVATLNMDEFAYGFATSNAHFGVTRNPHDPARLAGGSSGGSAAAVAAGMLAFSLGSDTNGSIRIPAALCGVYGLKPSHGALPMKGVFPFAESFDDIGPMAASVADLALVHRALSNGGGGMVPAHYRVARLGGWFRRNAAPQLLAGIDGIADFANAPDIVELPEVPCARSAAFLMTAAEGGHWHLPQLRRRAMAFDPETRDRLIAGAMLPASAYFEAQDFRRWFREQVSALFRRHDILIAPATCGAAPEIDNPFIEVDGRMVPARANLGLYTQPLSFVGLPVLAAPLLRQGELPLGIQLIAAPGGEAKLFAFAARLEEAGLIGTSPPNP